MNKLRFVIYYPRAKIGNGGPTVAVWLWVGALLQAGQSVAVIYDKDLCGDQPLQVLGVDLVACAHHGSGRWRRPVRFDSLIRPHDIVFVHSAFLAGNLIVSRHARAVGAYVVFVPHGAYEQTARQRSAWLKRLWLLWEGRELERALAIHAFVETETPSIREVAPTVPIVTVPTPINIPEEQWQGGGGYLAWFGRYDIEHKGLDLLVQAYAHLPVKLRKPMRLRGRDSTHGRHAVQALVDQAGLGDWIDVGPSVEGYEKTIFLREADLFVMPSRWESFSIALLEVLALGVPSLVSSRMPIAGQLAREKACRVVDIEPEVFAAELAVVLADLLTAFTGYSPRDFAIRHLSTKGVGLRLVEQLTACISARGPCA